VVSEVFNPPYDSVIPPPLRINLPALRREIQSRSLQHRAGIEPANTIAHDNADVRRRFAQKSYELFLKEWRDKGHVHENYNAIAGAGDDVTNSDRSYHWGALLGYVEYMEQTHPSD
jgi:hypothetical protein